VAQTSARLRGAPAPHEPAPAPAVEPVAAEPAPEPAPTPVELADIDVDVTQLAVFKLFARAQKHGGQASAAKLLAAMARDGKALRTLLERGGA
jgi:hypothetical protein